MMKTQLVFKEGGPLVIGKGDRYNVRFPDPSDFYKIREHHGLVFKI